MVRSTFDWSLWIILVFEGLAHPHSWIPYVQIGFNMHLFINVLFSRESLDFRPKSHDICRTFKLSCWRLDLVNVKSGFVPKVKRSLPVSHEELRAMYLHISFLLLYSVSEELLWSRNVYPKTIWRICSFWTFLNKWKTFWRCVLYVHMFVWMDAWMNRRASHLS
jgi:hypothetical protein